MNDCSLRGISATSKRGLETRPTIALESVSKMMLEDIGISQVMLLPIMTYIKNLTHHRQSHPSKAQLDPSYQGWISFRLDAYNKLHFISQVVLGRPLLRKGTLPQKS
jgi:hypothetical protein